MICPKCGINTETEVCSKCGFSFKQKTVVTIGDCDSELQLLCASLNKASRKTDIVEAKPIAALPNNSEPRFRDRDRLKKGANTDNTHTLEDVPGDGNKHWPIIILMILIITIAAGVMLKGFIIGSKEEPSEGDGWGRDERELYTNDSQAPYAVYNSITDNAAVGDERNFVRVREIGSNEMFRDIVDIKPGKEYEVYIYYRNDADPETNLTGYGLANNTRVASAYPVELKAGEKGMISGIITWSYVTPESPADPSKGIVWDEAYITAKEDVLIKFRASSAVIHNGGKASGSILPTNLFDREGTPIGYNKLEGRIPGGAEYSGYIIYTLVVEKLENN